MFFTPNTFLTVREYNMRVDTYFHSYEAYLYILGKEQTRSRK